jgi:hypothetical protein
MIQVRMVSRARRSFHSLLAYWIDVRCSRVADRETTLLSIVPHRNISNEREARLLRKGWVRSEFSSWLEKELSVGGGNILLEGGDCGTSLSVCMWW